MINLQKGFVVPVILVVIALLVIGGGVFVYKSKKVEAPAVVDTGTQQANQNQQTNSQTPPVQNTKTPDTQSPKVPASQSPTSVKSASYDLISGILSTLNVKNINLVNAPLEWNTGKYETPGGKMIKETYNGYSFVVTNSPTDNEHILQTWKTTGKVDELDISSRFGGELKNRGFVPDWSNSGDATFNSSSGFSKGNLVCIIKHKITIPPEQVDDSTGRYSSVTTVICADKNNK